MFKTEFSQELQCKIYYIPSIKPSLNTTLNTSLKVIQDKKDKSYKIQTLLNSEYKNKLM